jgi:6-phosphogluconolactonase
VADAACRLIGMAASAAIAERGRFRLVLAGGSTPLETYRRLAASDQQWKKWTLYYGDERCHPTDHPERNSVMVARPAWRHWRANTTRSRPNWAPRPRRPSTASASRRPCRSTWSCSAWARTGTPRACSRAQVAGQAGLRDRRRTESPRPSGSHSGRVHCETAARCWCWSPATTRRDAVRRWRDGEPLPIARVADLDQAQVLVDRSCFYHAITIKPTRRARDRRRMLSIAADIGGTNSRVALVEDDAGGCHLQIRKRGLPEPRGGDRRGLPAARPGRGRGVCMVLALPGRCTATRCA